MKNKIILLILIGLSFISLNSCNLQLIDNTRKEGNITNRTIITEIDKTSKTENITKINNLEITNIDLNGYINSLIDNTKDFIPAWNKESFKGKWNYIDGVFLNSLVNIYKITKDDKYKNFVINYVDKYISDSGDFLRYVFNGETYNIYNDGYTIGELDTVCESKILFDLYEWTKDSKYLNLIGNTYLFLLRQSRLSDGICFSHKESYKNQVWLDGFYMYVPFYLRYALLKNDSNIFDEVKLQYQFVNDNMKDDKTGLFYHGYDDTKSIFWADRKTGCSKSFWSRSIGWFVTSLVDSIEYFPDGNNKKYLINLLNNTLNSIYKFEDKNSHMYYQLTDKGNKSFTVDGSYFSATKNTKYKDTTTISNYLESSSSSMFAYSYLKAARLNYVDCSFMIKRLNTFSGIYSHSYNSNTNTLNDICIAAGLGPENKPKRDGTPAYYLAEPVGSNDAKGVGPFLMAYTEYLKLK